MGTATIILRASRVVAYAKEQEGLYYKMTTLFPTRSRLVAWQKGQGAYRAYLAGIPGSAGML
jgi:hypothetical protein